MLTFGPAYEAESGAGAPSSPPVGPSLPGPSELDPSVGGDAGPVAVSSVSQSLVTSSVLSGSGTVPASGPARPRFHSATATTARTTATMIPIARSVGLSPPELAFAVALRLGGGGGPLVTVRFVVAVTEWPSESFTTTTSA